MKPFVKKVYQALPFKKHFFSLIKLIPRFPKGIYQHLTFTGPFKVELGEGKNFTIFHHGFQIENELFWEGIESGWEKHSMKIWRHLAKRSNTIFDIGANTGVYALTAKALHPKASVYSFEPVARVFDKLVNNVSLNDFEITCENIAISNESGKAIIYDANTEHTLSVSVNKNISLTPKDTFEVEIDTITLDSYIEQQSIKSIDLMKIDVEMHEVEAIEGFRKHIKAFRPDFLIEILNDDVGKGIENLIRELEYVYFNIDENTGVTEIDSLSKSSYYNVLVCKETTANEIRKLYHL